MPFNGETQSWEELQLKLIAQDAELLQNFQNLKYSNSEPFEHHGNKEWGLTFDYL